LWLGGLWFEEEEWDGGEETEDESGKERVKVGAIEIEIGGRAEVRAEEVGVGNHAGENDGDGGSAGDAREYGALKGVRGQGVGEGVHREL